MMNGPQFIWAGIRGNNLHQADQGDVEYVRKDIYDAQTAELAALLSRAEAAEAALAKSVRDAFFEGFGEGRDGGWVWGDPTPAWNKSDSKGELKK